MYLVEVEFHTWYDLSKPIKADYIKDNYAIFTIDSEDNLYLFLDESEAIEEVKKVTVFKYMRFQI